MKNIIVSTIVLGVFFSLLFSCMSDRNEKPKSNPDLEKTSAKSTQSKKIYQLEKGDLKFELAIKSTIKNKMGFELKVFKSSKEVLTSNGQADLILLEDENGKEYIPEGTFIVDENSKEEYQCDSSYQFIAENYSLSFGLEKLTRKKISFVIYNTSNKFLPEGDYTLNQIKK